MKDREALAAALAGPPPNAPVEWFLKNNPILAAAARERLAQLPEKCGTCEGTGMYDQHTVCSDCRGSGNVYPAELVKLFEQTLKQCWKQHATFEAMALTLLDALNGETP